MNDRADPSHRGRAVGPLLGGLALGYLAGRWRARGGFGSGVIFFGVVMGAIYMATVVIWAASYILLGAIGIAVAVGIRRWRHRNAMAPAKD
ncbi:MAG: hypothetical protein ACXVEX_07475 [Actinomycetota bacterium]